MNRIVDWIIRLRLGHRLRRLEALGGGPGQGPRLGVTSFTFDLHTEQRIKRVRDEVAQLGADSFDEGTDNPLDKQIDQDKKEWDHRLAREHAAYKARAGRLLDEADALAWQYRQLLDEDRVRLEHAEIAVEAAALALSGQEPEARPGHQRRITIAAEPVPPTPAPPTRDDDTVTGVRGEAGGQAAPPADPPPTVRTEYAAGVPAKVSPLELRRLLEPRDANRVPRWAEPGFRDPTLLAGRPPTILLYVLALVLAAGADIGAFKQTVDLVLLQSDTVNLVVVSGLTAVVLTIAHRIGVLLRESGAARQDAERQGFQRSDPRGRRMATLGCALVWLAVGLLAFWVRYTVPLGGSAQLGGSSSGSNSYALQAASIFLGLYLATGLVAAIGAYATHNPHRRAYASAIRGYRKASERTAASIHRFGLTLAVYQHQDAEIKASEEILKAALEENDAFAAELKQIARIEIAALVPDPAVIDAFFPKT